MKNTNLETPPYLVTKALCIFFDHFNRDEWIDMCATYKNKKFEKYWSPVVSGGAFKQNLEKYNRFCNPPFDNLPLWVDFCYNQHRKNNSNVMMLLPNYTDSKWWQNYLGYKMQYVDDYFFLSTRLGFLKNGIEITSNKYYMPCSFILWRKK